MTKRMIGDGGGGGGGGGVYLPDQGMAIRGGYELLAGDDISFDVYPEQRRIVINSTAQAGAPGSAPAGAILLWSTGSAPSGYLLCDGSAVSRTTYADLFAVIGETYGAGDGSTTFNLPNLKGRVPVGLDSGQTEFDALAETGGAKTHTLTEGEIPAHTHTQDSHNHTQNSHVHVQTLPSTQAGNFACGTRDTSSGGTGGSPGTVADALSTASATATNQAATAVNQNAGGGGAHNNLPPYLVLNYVIKT